MKISEMVMNQKQFLYVLAKLIEGTEAYLSCRNLLLSGIKLIGNDDLMHGLYDLRKALEMLLKKKLHNKLPIERQSSKRVVQLIEENGWGKVDQTLWPYLKYIFQKYQNAYVKHDDGTRITEQDADLCVKQALLLMMYIVSKKMYNNSRRGYDENE